MSVTYEREVGILRKETLATVDMPRARFLELVGQGLQGAESVGLRAELLPVAQSMERFPLGTWINAERGCGCVVGEYLIAAAEVERVKFCQEMVEQGLDYQGGFPTVEALLEDRDDADDLKEFGTRIDRLVREEIFPLSVDSVEIID